MGGWYGKKRDYEHGSDSISAGNHRKPPSIHSAASILKYYQANTYHDLSGRLPQTPDSHLISPASPSSTSGFGVYPSGQLYLLTLQHGTMQVENPTQTPTMPAPSHPVPIPWHPNAETIPGMTPGWTRCNTDHRRKVSTMKANTARLVGRISRQCMRTRCDEHRESRVSTILKFSWSKLNVFRNGPSAARGLCQMKEESLISPNSAQRVCCESDSSRLHFDRCRSQR